MHNLTVLGSSHGQVCLADARQNFKAQQILAAHAGGVTDVDLAGGLLATCGLGTRQGQLVPDTIVKVLTVQTRASSRFCHFVKLVNALSRKIVSISPVCC